MYRSKKFSIGLVGSIVADLRMGNTVESACYRNGIRPTTLQQWMMEMPDVEFAIQQARVAREYNDVKVLDDAIKAGGRTAVETAKWRLERLNPETWGKASRNDMWYKEEQVRRMIADLRAEGITTVTEKQLLKEWAQAEKKALPSGEQ